jgi:CRISPR-associated endoribonuclease Cas6
MRIKLRLDASMPSCLLPFDYAYALTALIYRTLEVSSPTYSTFLHDQGYHLPDKGKPFKLFTFSQLKPERYRVEPSGLRLLSSELKWQISSPMVEFVEHLAGRASATWSGRSEPRLFLSAARNLFGRDAGGARL